METRWLREVLFAGQTSNAFKLGTVLTLGWFWSRVAGCSVLYRGGSIETIDFNNILIVAEVDASEIRPPNYLQHSSNSTYFYVIRRTNNCGDQEYTLTGCANEALALGLAFRCFCLTIRGVELPPKKPTMVGIH